jgi:hypothetical protein
MNREHWAALLPIITAFANGQKVDFQTEQGEWSLNVERLEFIKSPSRYRTAPRTMRIGAFDVSEPYRGEMKDDQEYYLADPKTHLFYHESMWWDDREDNMRMKRGLIHLTREAAALHGKAIASLTSGEGVEL